MSRILFLILFISLSILAFGQQNEKEQKVNKYLNTLQKYQNDKKFEEIRALDDKRFREIEKILYEAKEIGEDVLKDSLVKDHDRWMSEIEKDKNNLWKKVKYGIVESSILEEVKRRDSNFDEILVRLPAFIKAKVISVTPGNDKFGFRVIMKVQPVEVLKCKVPYLLQKEFEVYFRDWGEGVSPDRDFKAGKSYMIPIWYRPDIDITETKYSVATFVDGKGSRFLVENDTMDDEFEAFGMGQKVKWSDFVSKFNKTINRIKNSGSEVLKRSK